ncbi:MAG: sugar phosphate isomerase/epimerase, partial [Caldilineaceae bacterium]|nr:sugar phosphate isomerase/epimerase [Caldilineaceae bacterium]
SLETALAIADEHGVTLAFEPEVNNVIDSPQRARRIIDELGSPRLKVVIDGANIFHQGELPHMTRILTEAIDLLGKDIVLAHAKDLDHDGDAGHLAAGTGLLDWELYLRLLRDSGYDGAIILHGLTEAQAPGCVAFLRTKADFS